MKICYLHYSKKAKQIITINISKPIWTILKILGKGIKCIITIKNLSSDIPKSYLTMVPLSQTKEKFQMSLTIILQRLLEKQKKVSVPRSKISLISLKKDIKTPIF